MTLRQKTRLYATPNNTRACFELIGTIAVFFIAAFVALEMIGLGLAANTVYPDWRALRFANRCFATRLRA